MFYVYAYIYVVSVPTLHFRRESDCELINPGTALTEQETALLLALEAENTFHEGGTGSTTTTGAPTAAVSVSHPIEDLVSGRNMNALLLKVWMSIVYSIIFYFVYCSTCLCYRHCPL